MNSPRYPSLLSPKAFTLIELLVSVGILAIIAGVSITAFITLSSAYDKADVVTKVNHEGSRVMEQLVRTVRNSEGATVDGDDLVLDIPIDQSNLEYAANGNCNNARISYDNVNHRLVKTTDNHLVNCEGTAVCTDADPCILNSNDIAVWPVASKSIFSVTENPTDPDLVVINFLMSQASMEADVEGLTSLEFERSVLTRGY